MPDISISSLFIINAAAIIAIGIFGVLSRSNFIKILLSINILQTGVNLLLVALGYVEKGEAAIITEQGPLLNAMVDPLPQAMVLTSIVIGFGTTALGLALAINYAKSKKTLDIYKKDLGEKE